MEADPPTELNAFLTSLGDRIAALEKQNSTLGAQNLELHNRLAKLSKSSSNAGKNEPKLADPEPYSGSRIHLIDFLSKCRLKFAGQPSKFTTENSKIYYAGSYLREQAYSWFQPLLTAAQDPNRPNPEEFESFETFATALSAIYGDPDLEASAERQLNTLVQGGSVAQYNAEFQRLRQYVKWDESALKNRFYLGLKDGIKDWLATQERSTTLKDLIDKATRHDARKYERFQEKKNPSAPPPRSPNAQPKAPQPQIAEVPSTGLKVPSHTTDGTVPMEIGTRRLTEAERERRRVNNLCYYCGEPGHTSFNCTKKPKRIPFFEVSFDGQSVHNTDVTAPSNASAQE